MKEKAETYRLKWIHRGRQNGKFMLNRILQIENMAIVKKFEKDHAGSIAIIDRAINKEQEQSKCNSKN